MSAATVDYLLDLPWFAVSDPDEPTPIYDALTAEVADKPARRDERGRFTKAGRR